MSDLLAGGDDLPPLDESKDYLTELVGENKKFKDVKDLAKGKYLADLYVEDLKRQKDQLRTEYLQLKEESTARAKLQELIDKLQSTTQQSQNTSTLEVRDNTKAQFDPNQFDSLISNKLVEYETQKKMDNNWNTVKDKLTERYGVNYQPIVKSQIDELGLSVEDFNSMARKSPNTLIRALGLNQATQQEDMAPPRHTQRVSDPFRPSTGKERTWAYYQEIKKSNSNLYWEPKTQAQMHKDHERLGSKFEDGDFHIFG